MKKGKLFFGLGFILLALVVLLDAFHVLDPIKSAVGDISIIKLLLAVMFLGYAVSQRIDVWLYHKWWEITTKKSGSKRAYLWLRNNGSTLISQIINTLIFNLIAFGGVYGGKTLVSIVISSYVIYFFTSLLDTPVVYAARWLKEKGKIPD